METLLAIKEGCLHTDVEVRNSGVVVVARRIRWGGNVEIISGVHAETSEQQLILPY